MMMAITTISSMRVKAPPAPNDEARMSNVEGLINPEDRMRARFFSSFVIRISSFPPEAASRLLLQPADDANERREEGKHDGADNHGEQHDHDWLQHRGESCHRVIDLVIVNVGNL